MPRKNTTIEFNSFTKGLVTEASPLTFPDNASLSEVNFNLNRDGSRRRRLGMNYESGAVTTTWSEGVNADGEVIVNSFLWTDSSKDNQTQLIVVQINSRINFYDTSVTPVSDGLVYTYQSVVAMDRVQFASVDGNLVVINRDNNPLVFNYTNGVMTREFIPLKIRDQFGLEDVLTDGTDLRDGNNKQVRPEEITNAHLYNLRNQGWGTPRRDGNREDLSDPIEVFYRGESFRLTGVDLETELPIYIGADYERYPSNSDQVGTALYADPEDSGDRIGERFFVRDLIANHDRVGEAANGYFIINALSRGQSRMESLEAMYARNDVDGNIYTTPYKPTSLPVDTSAGGATTVATYAGRAWYAGFSSESLGGDSHSPLMSSYVLFSQLVKSKSDMTSCYQVADPTSTVDSDLVDTDGGFIRISGAEKIVKLEQLGNKLIVFATNGAWSVSGIDDGGFTATSYQVVKITDAGTESPSSVAVVDSAIMYWAVDGIYVISSNEFGSLGATNLTSPSIQTLYQQIPFEDKVACCGQFDKYDRKVRWLYGNRVGADYNVIELIFDVDLKAFYQLEIAKPIGETILPLSMVQTPPYVVGDLFETVTVDGEVVTVDAVDVTEQSQESRNQFREIKYLTVTGTDPLITTTFSEYRDPDFLDWTDSLAGGVDAAGHLLTGHISGGDFQRIKQVPYITTHMNRTEDGFELVNGDVVPTNRSGCMLSARWEWTDSINSGRWSNPKEIYRYKRHYMPTDLSDPYDYGFDTIVTKNKIRGKGRTVSLLFETEPLKDCHIIGWSMIVGVNGNV